MNLHITNSKNAESFYICKSYVKANGSTTSTIVRKLGTLEQLLPEHGPTRDEVVAWAKNEAKIETEKYKKEKEAKTVLIPFHADRQLDYGKQTFFRGGYLFIRKHEIIRIYESSIIFDTIAPNQGGIAYE